MSNILAKINPIREHLAKFEVYYPYSIKDGERPDTIAYDYYGSSDYAWLVMIVNDIYDPYYQWPLTYSEFYDYLFKKYKKTHELMSEICFYRYTGIGGETAEEIARKSWNMTPETYALLSPEGRSGWTPVYVYDYENELNESKRQIRLLSNQYRKQIDRELNELFNVG